MVLYDISLKISFNFLCILALLIMPFSPYLSYIIILTILLVFSFKSDKIILLSVFFTGSVCQFFILHSRSYIVEQMYDLSAYYSAFNVMNTNTFYSFLDFDTYETGWFFIYRLLSYIIPNASIYDIAEINTIICLLLFTLWLFRHGLCYIENKYIGLVLGCTLLFLWQTNFSFFQRQSLSISILLFAISNIHNGRNNKFIIYLFLASIFHITSLLLGLIYFYIIKIQKNKLDKLFIIKLLFLLISIRFTFSILIDIISNIGWQDLSKKANFYTDSIHFFLSISELRFLPLFVIIFLNYKYIDISWRKIILFSSICYISLLGLQFASGRINFILFYLYGYFLFLATYKKPKILFLYIYIYFIFDILYKSGIIFDINDPYWQRYPIFDYIPFYYLI